MIGRITMISMAVATGCWSAPRFAPVVSKAPSNEPKGLVLSRAYEDGERFRYRLTVNSGMQGGDTKTVVSVSSHVVKNSRTRVGARPVGQNQKLLPV